MNAKVQNAIDASMDTVVAHVNSKPYTRRQLAKAFDSVKDSEHWKNPIDCRIKNPGETSLRVIEQSVSFFAGCTAHFRFDGDDVIVTAKGYFLSIGA